MSVPLQHSINHSANAAISGASEDRGRWEADEAESTDQIKRTEDMLETSRITLLNQENAFEEAGKSKERCKELHNKAKGFQSDLVAGVFRHQPKRTDGFQDLDPAESGQPCSKRSKDLFDMFGVIVIGDSFYHPGRLRASL